MPGWLWKVFVSYTDFKSGVSSVVANLFALASGCKPQVFRAVWSAAAPINRDLATLVFGAYPRAALLPAEGCEKSPAHYHFLRCATMINAITSLGLDSR